MPLHRRIPKRGFHNPATKEFAVVNLDFARTVFAAGETVTPENLRERGIVRRAHDGIKVLGDGDLKVALTVHAHAFSGSARRKDRCGRRQGRTFVMSSFFQALANIFRIPDLRKRLLFTLAMLAVYRLGAFMPTPGINTDVLRQYFQQNQGSVLGIFDLFSGGNFRRLTIFALGIMPYITASIILQLMTVVWPYLESLQKEGELGRKKITQYTRYLTILLSLFQSLSIALTLQQSSFGPDGTVAGVQPGRGLHADDDLDAHHRLGLHHVAGRTDHRTRHRQRNVADHFCRHRRGPAAWRSRSLRQSDDTISGDRSPAWRDSALVAFMLAVVGFIVFVEGGQRRIPVQYAKRVVGRKVMGGQMTYLPLRVNCRRRDSADFCQFVADFPGTIALFMAQKYSFPRSDRGQ